MDECYTWDVGSVWHKHWPAFMYIGQWPIFHSPVIFPYILKTIWWTNAIIGILVPCDAKIYHIKCICISDLHFMVQWCYFISWRLFDRLMLYWRYCFSVTKTLNWTIHRSVTYISWSNGLMDKCHDWNIEPMWCKDLPHKMYVGQWSTFHGPVILSYILKTIWWINTVLETLIQCDKYWTDIIYVGQWPIFHGPVILPYILKTFWWTNVIIGILDPCDAKIYHLKCLWVSDLHFMVQWLCLEDFLMEECCTEYIDSVQHCLTYKYICRSVTYILWYSDSALHFKYYLMNKPHSLDIGSNMGHWPIFQELAILNHLLISAYSGLLKFDLKVFVNVARLEIGQLFTQGWRQGHPCTLDTFIVCVCVSNSSSSETDKSFIKAETLCTYQCFPLEVWGGGMTPFENLGSNSPTMSHNTPGHALKFTHNFFQNFNLRSRPCVKVFHQILLGK